MPNNIRNDVTITGPKAVLAQIAEFMRGDESAFDFNKILPMPEELLSITTGSTTIGGQQFRRWRTIDGKDIGISPAESETLREKYGACDWYDWAVSNWGTKWDAYCVDDAKLTSRSLKYGFDTAWASPEPVLQALADKFQVSIRVAVSGETYDGKRYTYYVNPSCDVAA